MRFSRYLLASALICVPVWGLMAEEELGDGALRMLVVPAAVVTPAAHAEVPAREAGPLTKILCREGSVVREGDLIAMIDHVDAQIAVERAKAELEVAMLEANNDLKLQAALKAAEVAKTELRRALDSTEAYSRSVSQTELDRLRLIADQSDLQAIQAKHELEVARVRVHLCEINLEMAQRSLERHEIRAPIDGVALDLAREPGEWVEPGATIVRLVRMDTLRIEGFVPMEELPASLVGAPVRISLNQRDQDDAPLRGVLVYVSPEVDPVNGQVRFRAEVDNADGQLRPGMNCRVEILLQ